MLTSTLIICSSSEAIYLLYQENLPNIHVAKVHYLSVGFRLFTFTPTVFEYVSGIGQFEPRSLTVFSQMKKEAILFR
ncbi:hypothetical protein NPIL_346851 [Nephila pilipes]|uniref:Uncharacterized protein n=1 Tax=Nephila pilipes TaxID=299642 RepID=A0A8X6PTY3_NEPPI|nr:hypothetical protein NPIL_587251 [Nephila pilipes]GFT83145.1 hypothetical protein NPIL_346851 [Nephila pilipes]